jgi:hypothetical protein
MEDNVLTDHFDAVSGKLDIALTRLEAAESKMHDALLRLANLETMLGGMTITLGTPAVSSPKI